MGEVDGIKNPDEVMEGGRRTGRPGEVTALAEFVRTFGSQARGVLEAGDFNLPPT